MRRDPVTGDIVLSRRPGGWVSFFELVKEMNIRQDFNAIASAIHHECISNASRIHRQFIQHASAMRAAGDLAQRVLYRIA